MDIDYLLFLQDLRNGALGFLAPIMSWFTEFSVSALTVLLVPLIYLVFDRKNGKRLLCGMGLCYLLNGILKLCCCVYRPWIRDTRIEPWGNAKVDATGYSFPSGHATAATSRYGSAAIWTWSKKRWISIIFFLLILITMFSRNFLGVHTPQDVLVGCISSFLMLFVGFQLEKWSDKNPKRNDLIIMLAGLCLAVILIIFFTIKSYPLDYTESGALLVDPKSMINDSYEGLGFLVGYCISRFFERRGFDFEAIDWKERFVITVFAFIPLCWWYSHIVSIFTDFGLRFVGKFLQTSMIPFYTMIVVPFIMKKVDESGLMEKITNKIKVSN